MDPEILYRIIGMLYTQNIIMDARLKELQASADKEHTSEPGGGDKPRPVAVKAGRTPDSD
jgi:hypothetical protein